MLDEPLGILHMANERFEGRVAQNAQSLFIPQNLKDEILVSIRPVRDQVRQWIKLFKCYLPVKMSNALCWTSLGLIDYTKTASNIIRRGDLPPMEAFEIACITCSVEHIYELWPLVRNGFDENMYFWHPEITSWVQHLQDTFETNLSLNRNILQEGIDAAFLDGNLSALKLFCEQNLGARKVFIKIAEKMVENLDCDVRPVVILFLFSYMDGTEQDQYMRKDPKSYLLGFLSWPLQHFFLQVADKLWECCSEDVFLSVIRELIENIHVSKNAAMLYKNLFTQFWKRSPLELRNSYVQKEFGSIFRKLFYPSTIDDALNILFSGACDEQILYTTFLHNAYSSLCFILESDKRRAFQALFQKFVSHDEASIEKFEKSFWNCRPM